MTYMGNRTYLPNYQAHLAAIRALRKLHAKVEAEDSHGFFTYCKDCEKAYPCPTTVILDNIDTDAKEISVMWVEERRNKDADFIELAEGDDDVQE